MRVAVVWPLRVLLARWRERERWRLGRWEFDLGCRKAMVPPCAVREEEPLHIIEWLIGVCVVLVVVGRYSTRRLEVGLCCSQAVLEGRWM